MAGVRRARIGLRDGAAGRMRSQCQSIPGDGLFNMRRQDSLFNASYTGSHHLALLIGECAVVFMRGPNEIVTGAHKLLDLNSDARLHDGRLHDCQLKNHKSITADIAATGVSRMKESL